MSHLLSAFQFVCLRLLWFLLFLFHIYIFYVLFLLDFAMCFFMLTSIICALSALLFYSLFSFLFFILSWKIFLFLLIFSCIMHVKLLFLCFLSSVFDPLCYTLFLYNICSFVLSLLVYNATTLISDQTIVKWNWWCCVYDMYGNYVLLAVCLLLYSSEMKLFSLLVSLNLLWNYKL